MKVLIISGFLGAGKTTFIKELLNNTDRFAAVLENEFGDTNLDSREISGAAGADNTQVLEFMEGCVCCSKKDSFLYSILTVSTSVSPDYLIVEPSGVAKLSNILAGLEKIRYEKIIPVSPIVIISAQSFFSNLNEYPDLMKDQISNAGNIIFSKTEGMGADEISEIKKKIGEINPDAKITESYRDSKSKEWWIDIMSDEAHTVPSRDGYGEGSDEDTSFDQISFECMKFDKMGDLVGLCDKLIAGNYGSVARAKGVVKVHDEAVRFDVADNNYAITGGEEPFQTVIIGTEIDREKLFFEFGESARHVKMTPRKR
ncbi:MAG: hypothetical protein J5802_05015 [Butyrivibrio sp.]|nr:hypothetical protein [Butyrivibrio sp.]